MTHKEFNREGKDIADYFREYGLITKNLQTEGSSQFKKIKIAALSSSTIEGLKEILFVKCYELGIIPEIFIGGYNQYNQEIIDENSQLYDFKPDLVILFIDTKSLLGDVFFSYYQLPEEETRKLLEHTVHQVNALANRITQNLNCKVVLHNFEVPLYSPLGILENKQELGFIEFVRTINSNISKEFKRNTQIFVFDYDAFCSKWGKENILDYKMYYLGDIQISFPYLPKLCQEYIAYIKPLASLTKKCIVLDLDNVLWGGVIGEDGLEGIKLGPTPEGRPFLEFQKYLLSLFNRGVILAINSKNNSEDVYGALREHPYMVLKEKHFASIKANWNDKISNMKEIAQELDIGLESFVFFDDDPFNREIIKGSLPEVLVVDLPQDPSLYLKTLMELDDFNSFQYSEEDKRRGQMYAEQRKRQELSQISTDITEYLQALEMVITIEEANPFTIPRISQLTQKTNQFTMTTKRYLEEDIRKMAEGKESMIFSVKVVDKFGDNGITGVAIVKKGAKQWLVDSFLLSCRVIGRRVEETMLAYILERARMEHAASIVGEFIPTKKNILAEAFYKKNDFTFVGEKEGRQLWEFSVEKEYAYPDFIKVITV